MRVEGPEDAEAAEGPLAEDTEVSLTEAQREGKTSRVGRATTFDTRPPRPCAFWGLTPDGVRPHGA